MSDRQTSYSNQRRSDGPYDRERDRSDVDYYHRRDDRVQRRDDRSGSGGGGPGRWKQTETGVDEFGRDRSSRRGSDEATYHRKGRDEYDYDSRHRREDRWDHDRRSRSPPVAKVSSSERQSAQPTAASLAQAEALLRSSLFATSASDREIEPDKVDRQSQSSQPPVPDNKEASEDQMMQQMMGFSGFTTTKGQKASIDSDMSGARVVKQQRYRQYMNKKTHGGLIKEI